MIREAIITTVITAAVGGSGYAMKFWADNTYIRQDVYTQSKMQERIWTLQDQADALKDKAAFSELKPHEERRLERIQQEIENLRNDPR